MSYIKILSIRITDEKVFWHAYESSDLPPFFMQGELPGMSRLLVEKGREEVEKHLLFIYFEGVFHGNDKYQSAADKIRKKLKCDESNEVWSRCNRDENYRQKIMQMLHDEFVAQSRITN